MSRSVVAAEQRDQRAVAEFPLERRQRFVDAGRDEEASTDLRRTIEALTIAPSHLAPSNRMHVRISTLTDAG